MAPKTLVWLALCGGLVLALSATGVPGWVLGVAGSAALILAVPLSVRRFRVERNLARTLWRTLPVSRVRSIR